jgi:hypothetical protein
MKKIMELIIINYLNEQIFIPAKKDSKTPRCTKKGISGYNVTYEKDKHHGRLFFPILCIGPFFAFM